ncbi:hypothetical protein RBH29_09600 [Herbivorax sp. ANBcel31]|uniref:hypothetical protein n=1 Tax=Herbivorax sp. ANBcel31 TaxID=3069754 RepID=UPI0027B879FC|nr:hypothetical protein [Herbivorax sp. ANBcel31]MDQ2086678.1 hypothetical protein [Herbivorax sp. ANBcel31]
MDDEYKDKTDDETNNEIAQEISNENVLNYEENIKRDDRSISLEKSNRLYVVLGWISAALTTFINPIFAVAGVIFGVLLNRQVKGSGNVIIIVNVVLALFVISFQLLYMLMFI